jgi:hypothetical protein
MHLHAVLRIKMIGSQESCGLQAQGWCGTHPGRVCICRAGKILDSDDNGGGKVNLEDVDSWELCGSGLGRGLPR